MAAKYVFEPFLEDQGDFGITLFIICPKFCCNQSVLKAFQCQQLNYVMQKTVLVVLFLSLFPLLRRREDC